MPRTVGQPRVEFFDVTCLCGRSISGQRLSRPQAVECLECGERLFVLPIDAYPPVGLMRRHGSWPEGGGRSPRFPAGWIRGGWAAAASLASGRLLLVAILATMTASLLFAFWIDAQSRYPQGERFGAKPERAESPAAALEPAVQSGSIAPAEHVLSGHVQDGRVVIDGALDVPDGTHVSIQVIPDGDRRRHSTSEEAHR